MKIGLITTLQTNIGDDFIRVGLCSVLKHVFGGHRLRFTPVNKHRPLTIYPPWHPIRSAPFFRRLPRGGRRLERWIENGAARLGRSKFHGCDLIVQCGTPVIWEKCWTCEWAGPIWHRVVGRLSGAAVPVLNLGAGSCFPWERQPKGIEDPDDLLYLQKITGYCRATTARDALAQRLFRDAGSRCPLLPCPAFLAGRALAGPGVPQPGARDLVLLNYMDKGGHFDWGQKIQSAPWQRLMKAFISHNRNHHRLAFVCHNRNEFDLAARIASDVPRFMPTTPEEYFKLVRRAKVALCNRLHASVALAGLGIPSVSVGTDTRLLMVRTLGLPSFYVKEISPEVLQGTFEHLLTQLNSERDRLIELREQTFHDYAGVIEQTVAND